MRVETLIILCRLNTSLTRFASVGKEIKEKCEVKNKEKRYAV